MLDRPLDSTLDATHPARPGDEAAAPTPEVSSETAPEVPLGVGERAGDFVIEGVIGRGSFGTVYRAAHAVIGRRAAVKVLREHAAEAGRIASFVDEARLVARLRHPNIVDVLTFGRLEDGRHYQVMDLIEGPTLTDFMREHAAVPLTAALPILHGIASALDAVHRAGAAHSDLKPANVVLERREGELVPKLIDFGVAKLIAPDAERTPATRGALVGTPRYMSPEQCRGQTVDARADAYAFGLLAYEMLTGRPPFSGDDALELMLKHTSETPVDPSRLCASLPATVDPIVLGLLEKRPERRPVELVPVVRALEAAASDQAPATAHDRRARSFWRAAPIAGAALVVAIAAIAFSGRRSGLAAAAHPAAGTTTNIVPPTSVARQGEAQPAPTGGAVTAAEIRTDTNGSDGGALGMAGAAKTPRGDRSSRQERRSRVAPKLPADDPSPRPSSTPGLEDPENPFAGR